MSFETDTFRYITEHKLHLHPLEYVMWAFPWKTDPEIQKVPLPEEYRERFPGYEYGPDRWACQFLDDLGAEIQERKFNGRNAVRPIRFSTASGHGIGKSTMTGWLVMFIMDTRPMSKIVVTANTSEQLRTKTWASVAMWHSKSVTAPLWEITTGRGAMSLYRKFGDKHVQSNWRTDGLTCRAENSESFQGLHAAGATACFIFDEASGIDDVIFEARSGAASDGEPMWFDWGNPTRKSGYFYENTVGKHSHRYNTRSINSQTTYLANNDLFQEWIDDYGIDSDFVKVKVLGQFPAAGSLQFIANDVAEIAARRPVIEVPGKKAILGVDVARFGDNSTVIYPRVGDDARSFGYKEYKGLDGWQVADKVKEVILDLQSVGIATTAIFVDGGGLGSSAVDALRHTGFNPIDCNFAHKAGNPKYARKGDEMWGNMRDALANRLCIAASDKLLAQLTQREYGITEATGRIQLERKTDLIGRLGIEASPDIADALALTYYSDVADDVLPPGHKVEPKFVRHEYDPWAQTW